MIDLHMHTVYSDGADTLIDILKKAQNNKLEYISITDHDNCNSYMELNQINVKDYYDGKIIPGIEIKCSYNGRLIEVLGYNINTDKMKKWTDIFYKDKSKPILQQKYFDLLYDKILDMGLILSPKSEMKFNNKTDWASFEIYKDIKKHIENKEKVPEDFWNEFDAFSKKYCGDKESTLYIDKSKDYPSVQEAIDAIKQAEGLVFLPHLFIYKWAENIYQLIDDLLEEYDIDGIECYHSEFTEENITYLLDLCKKRNYLISGGSDYHGDNKKGVDMGIGKGNLRIEKNIIEEWT